MGQMIHKPDTDPIIVAVANGLLFGAAGYYLMGQQKKAMYAAGACVALILLSLITCGIGGILAGPLLTVVHVACAYDAYLLGQRLQKGEKIGENENALEFLNNVFKD